MRESAVVPAMLVQKLLARVAKCQLSGETAHGESEGTGFPNNDALAYLGFLYCIHIRLLRAGFLSGGRVGEPLVFG